MKIRASLGYRVVCLAPLLLLIPLWVFVDSYFAHWLSVYWLAYSLSYLVVGLWFGIDLTASAAVVHSLRYRRIPWSEVQAVTQEPFMAGRRVVLWTVDGQRVPLRAPIVDFTGFAAEAFEERFHIIGRWWLAHREFS